ncbi:MAG: hypothetical protein ACRCUA_05230 [Fusobacteriaceae bacterium]
MKFFLIILIFFIREKISYPTNLINIDEYKIEYPNEKFKILEIEIEIKNLDTKKINSILVITKKNQKKSWFKIFSSHYLPFIEIQKCSF